MSERGDVGLRQGARPVLNAPYTMVAIGDPPTLAAALNIPGE